jgi:cytidyltransferase-like protein
MKFGKNLREKTLKEWRFYAVDYKALKKSLKLEQQQDHDTPDTDEFFRLLKESEHKLDKFYHDKEKWAVGYIKTLEERVEALRDASSTVETLTGSFSESEGASLSSDDEAETEADSSTHAAVAFDDLDNTFLKLSKGNHQSFGTKQEWLKQEYRKMGSSKQFEAFIYAKKSLATFDRELSLLLEFLDLNKTAFSKILKKFDKRTGSSLRDSKLADIAETHAFLDGAHLGELKEQVSSLTDEVNALKPPLPEGWESRKVYTIGCFDLFHRGHQNVLLSLREFGYYIVAGVHDDASYFKLKNKYTIDNLETRMANVKPFVDQIYVIPSTDPLLYIQSMVSQQDIDMGTCCYARGDDMLQFPGREWVESVMPVHFVPRTEACSSTLIRTIYHAEDEEIRKKAAFAKTRYDGKPIDEDGNVLKFTKQQATTTA